MEILKKGLDAVRMSRGTYLASFIDVLRMMIETFGWVNECTLTCPSFLSGFVQNFDTRMIDSYYVLVEEHFGVGFMDVLNHADKTLKPVGVKRVPIFSLFLFCVITVPENG